MRQFSPFENKEVTLLDLLDGIIDTGVVIRGEILISIADIDLIIVDLKLLISSIESAFENSSRKIIEEAVDGGSLITG